MSEEREIVIKPVPKTCESIVLRYTPMYSNSRVVVKVTEEISGKLVAENTSERFEEEI